MASSDYPVLSFHFEDGNIQKGNLEDLQFKSLTVRLLSPSSSPLMTWTFEHAFPIKWTVGNFNAQESAVAIDTVEFAYQKFTTS